MKTILIYYSYTGHTKMIAQRIQEKLGCDILELKPVKPYSKDYDEVVKEYQNNETAKKCDPIQDISIQIDSYDTVILGTPVWWYTVAPVVRTFLTQYSLEGKKIIPFATNGGWIGRTQEEIFHLCTKSVVSPLLDIKFNGDCLDTDISIIDEWIAKISH